MVPKKINRSFLVFLCMVFLANSYANQPSEAEKAEYRQDLTQIQAKRESLNPKLDKAAFQKDPDGYMQQIRAFRDKNDLNAYEKFADAILNNWASKNAEYYGRLTLALCADLGGGTFEDERCYELRRRYALSALEKRDALSVETELELTGLVTTMTIIPAAPKGQDFALRRKKDMEVRLHAWQRLLAAIDPAWNPNEQLSVYPDPPRGVNMWASGMDPNAIEDPVSSAEYKAALAANQRKIENHVEQNRLHKWLERYPKNIETYMTHLYSAPPYNNEELVQFLDDFRFDNPTKTRIINEVIANIQKSVNAGQNRID